MVRSGRVSGRVGLGRARILGLTRLSGPGRVQGFWIKYFFGFRGRFVKFYFEDELDDPERERHAVTVKAIQKIRAKQVVEVGSWAEIGWKPEGIK